jgi:L-ascorbate metabolism protein UlaG (beta-lactamase superfamily)
MRKMSTMKTSGIIFTILLMIVALIIIRRERVVLPAPHGPGANLKGMTIEAIGNRTWGATYKLTSRQGTVIITDPAMMGRSRPQSDVVTVSHRHFDHFDQDFVATSGARVSVATPESFQIKDIHVAGVAANHVGFLYFFGRNKVDPVLPSDVIYVYEIDGLKIAHFGDLGQNQLSQDQMNALGKVDVVIAKLNNPFVTLFCGSSDKRAFRLIEQLNPKVVIPTHTTDRSMIEYAEVSHRAFTVMNRTWVTNRAGIDDAPRRLVYLRR